MGKLRTTQIIQRRRRFTATIFRHGAGWCVHPATVVLDRVELVSHGVSRFDRGRSGYSRRSGGCRRGLGALSVSVDRRHRWRGGCLRGRRHCRAGAVAGHLVLRLSPVGSGARPRRSRGDRDRCADRRPDAAWIGAGRGRGGRVAAHRTARRQGDPGARGGRRPGGHNGGRWRKGPALHGAGAGRGAVRVARACCRSRPTGGSAPPASTAWR